MSVKTANNESKREFPRYAIAFQVGLSFADRALKTRTRNVSRGGLCIHMQDPIALSTECDIELSLVFPEERFSEQLKLRGMVVWCSRLPNEHQIGVRFTEMNPQSEHYLNVCMSFLSAADEDEED